MLLDPEDPRVTGPTIADNITGMYEAQGILSALLRRTHTGTGGHVEVTMLEAAISFMPDAFAQHSRPGIVSGPETRVRISQSYALCCRDSLLVAVHFSSAHKFWEGLLKVIERPDLPQDPQVRYLGTFARTMHPAMGEVIGIKSPIRFERTRCDAPPPLPELNAGAAAIVAEFGIFG